jgi:hypothetical protein
LPHLEHGLHKSPDSLFNCQRPRCRCSRPLLGGPRELGEVTPRCPPRQALFSTFFRGASALRPCRGFRDGGAYLRSPVRPVNTFFQLRPNRFSRPCRGFPLAESGYLPDRSRPVNTFFQSCVEAPVRFGPCPVSRKAEVRIYVPRFGPSTLFFKSVPLSRSGRARLSVRELGYLPNRPRNVNTFFQIPASALRLPRRPAPVSRSGKALLRGQGSGVKLKIALALGIFQNIVQAEGLAVQVSRA